MKRHIKANVHWVGVIDWEIRETHADAFKTHNGTTYNSYIVEEEKVALIDTVRQPFAREYVDNLEREGLLGRIDYVVMNHCEPDHSGALPELMSRLPMGTPLYCSPAAARTLAGHFKHDWNLQIVKTGDRLSLGSKELIFNEAPLLHWPDTMFSYLEGDGVLFSNDAFGQHYGAGNLFADQEPPELLMDEAMKYYACILSPFNARVKKKLEELSSLGWPLDVLCTSHGAIWRGDWARAIINKYAEWCEPDFAEHRVTVAYDTMWSGTRQMAEAIAAGVIAADPSLEVKVMSASKYGKSDILAEIFRSKAVVVGSPTINSGMLPSIAGLLEEIKGLKMKKKFAAFGSYGWSGEAAAAITRRLEEAGLEKITDELRVMWQPDSDGHAKCAEFGAIVAESIRG